MAERTAPAPAPAPSARRTAPYTADSLVEVAARVFLERGYDSTSMEHLARAAGISKSSIYHHVRGKEELLARATGLALDGLFASLAAAQAEGGRAGERLERVLRGMTRALLADLPYVTLLLRVRGNTPTERQALARRREFDAHIADLLREAVAEGSLHTAVDPRLAARLVSGTVNSVAEWYRPDHRDPEEIVDGVVHLTLHGLRA